MQNRWFLAPAASVIMGAACLTMASPHIASAQGTLRIGMTANDVPLAWGKPDNGFQLRRSPTL